ncbi:MAG: regulatory protein GemA [Marinobacter sp.]|uniref:gp16 family protein n=1 Tax=Marinobacter sp. TaxID=50741 RepID=UPI00299D0513|nr:regulatory protein GemA [Marinobacter sp.]MDX1755864.1 regulatory protein GemA [Marinobacter sp.]
MAARSNRKGPTAQIHIARKQLGMDEDTYRAMLANVTGKQSSKDCTVAELHKVVTHLKQLGFKAKPRKRVAEHPGTPHNLDSRPMLQKVEALLAELTAPWSYADAIAKRQFGIQRVAWLKTTEQYTALIAALDVELEKRSLLAALERYLEEKGLTLEDVEKKVASLPKNWRRNRAALQRLVAAYSEAEA